MASGQILSIPAPVKGWNVKDGLDMMDEGYAVMLDNWFPDLGQVSIRKGYSSYATGLGGTVEALIEFFGGSTRFFIAAANNKLWNISSPGAGTNITGAATITVNKWQWAQFDDASGGARVGLVNGTDAPLYIYKSGASPVVAAMTISGSGLTPSTLDGIHVFKNRTYFWDSRTQDFWYSSLNALGGVLTKFPLGRVSGTGGNLVSMQTWTIDGGAGPDDLAVFIMSDGNVLIYQGDDPGTRWGKVGMFKIGEPLSIRSAIRLGSDVLVMTKEGYESLAASMSGRADKITLSDKINPEVARVARLYSSVYGWQAIHYPYGNRLVFNAPVSTSEYHQHVLNTKTGAWCRFTGWNTTCFGIYNNRLYFGGSSTVYLADDGYTDGGSAIVGDLVPAWDYLQTRAALKQVTAIKPVLRTIGSDLSHGISVGADYKNIPIPTIGGTGGVSTTAWGAAWGSPWASEINVFSQWRSIASAGYTFTMRLRASTTAQSIDFVAANWLFKRGGLL